MSSHDPHLDDVLASPDLPSASRITLSYLTTTSSTAIEPAVAPRSSLDVLGWDAAGERAVFAEVHAGVRQLYVVPSQGERAGSFIPVASPRRTQRDLIPLIPIARDGWELHTRILHRRGVKVVGMATPIRKFSLGLTITRHDGARLAAAGRGHATAYLRPRAGLRSLWRVPSTSLAVAIIDYCGVPAGIGFDRQLAILAYCWGT